MAILFVIFCLFFSNSIAQNKNSTDSLITLLSNTNLSSTRRFEILYDINTRIPEPSLKSKYAKQLIVEAENLGDYKYIYLGYIAEGYAQKLMGNLNLALTSFLEAVKIASKNNDKIGEGDAYTNIATLYTSNEDYKNSLKYYDLVVKLYDDKVDSTRLCILYVNYGYATYKAELYDSSISILNTAIHFSQYVKSTVYRAYCQINMALVLAKTNNLSKAEALLTEAMETLIKNKDYYGLSDCLIEIGGVYFDEGQINLSIQKLEQGYEIAVKNGLKQQIQNGAKFLSMAYKQKGNIEKAWEYQSKYYAYRDSLVSAEKIRELADQRTEFEVGQKQIEVDLLTSEKRIQRIIIYSTTGGALLVVILLALVYKNYHDKNKLNKILEDQKTQLENLNSTKDKFFSIISHDLRGPVHAFSGISRLIKYAVEDKNQEELIEIADHVDKTADDLSGLLDGLLSWALQQQGHFPNVPEKLNLEEMGKEINGIFSNMAKAKDIEIATSIPEHLELWADKNTSMTIVRNLVNNALKFTAEGGRVSILAEANGAMAKITVKDTGVGISAEKLNSLFKMDGVKTSYGTKGEKGLGLGLQLVYEFVEMNNGTVDVESEEGKGTSFIVHLPLYEEVQHGVKV